MTRQIRVGNVLVGGGAPVSIQSMLNTKTTDVEGSLRQLKAPQAAGCQIARLAVPNEAAARSFREIAAQSPLPLVADIHFDYKLAIAAAEGRSQNPHQPRQHRRGGPGAGGGGGVQKQRHSHSHWRQWRRPGQEAPGAIRSPHGRGPSGERLFPPGASGEAGVLRHLCLYEVLYGAHHGGRLPPVPAAVRLPIAHRRDGDRSGAHGDGQVRHGHWSPLLDGIGETVRVSLTADPVQEVYAAREIPPGGRPLGGGGAAFLPPLRPRTSIDLIGLVEQVDQALRDCEKPITVAVMGCVVNGPGEAREADVGIAGGDGCGVLFVKGQPVQKLPYDQLLPTLLDYIQTL